MKKPFFSFLLFMAWGLTSFAQCPCDCPYPVLFIHGWTSSYTTWDATVNNTYFKNIWGLRADVFHAAANASTATNINGADGIFGTGDDDIQWVFANENNSLNAGCVYALNFDVGVSSNGTMSEMPLVGGSPGYFHSDNNESSITKQGALVGKAIAAILAANPTKKKVILVGHSMGGLASREYLQRRVNNNATSAPRWWVNPTLADGHKVAKLLTVGTPHRGSNTMGNLSNLRVANPENPSNEEATSPTTHKATDMLPDLNSEGVRDLRYSYDNLNPFGNDYPGVYLYGGKETDIPTFPTSYWTNDVNCNGTVNSTTQIGINKSGLATGLPYAWDGTSDNPSMPLPTNVRYTYYVSNTLSGGTLAGGDLVVDDQRQWLFTGGTGSGSGSGAGIPAPSDAVAHRLSDRIYLAYGPNHIAETGDTENIVRGLDEGDYPYFAWDVNKNVTYAGMAQVRANIVPEATNTTDGDWYKFTLTAASPVTITLNKTPGLAGRIDLFTSTPSNYAALTVTSNKFATFTAASTASVSVNVSNLNAGTYYFRVKHDNVTSTSWRTPYRFTISANAGARTAETIEEASLLTFSSYPNPTNAHAVVDIQLANASFLRMELFNSIGENIQTLYEGDMEGGVIHSLPYKMENLPAGIYFLQAQGMDFTKTLRIIKQ